MTGQIINPFYIQMGYTLEEIGFVVKTIALGASILGFFVGGKLIKSTGVNNSLIIGALLVMITNLFFAYIAISEKSLASLSLVVALDSMAAGIVGTVNITFLTSLVSKQYTGCSICSIYIFYDASRKDSCRLLWPYNYKVRSFIWR